MATARQCLHDRLYHFAIVAGQHDRLAVRKERFGIPAKPGLRLRMTMTTTADLSMTRSFC